jgi:hypothetical protein
MTLAQLLACHTVAGMRRCELGKQGWGESIDAGVSSSVLSTEWKSDV